MRGQSRQGHNQFDYICVRVVGYDWKGCVVHVDGSISGGVHNCYSTWMGKVDVADCFLQGVRMKMNMSTVHQPPGCKQKCCVLCCRLAINDTKWREVATHYLAMHNRCVYTREQCGKQGVRAALAGPLRSIPPPWTSVKLNYKRGVYVESPSLFCISALGCCNCGCCKLSPHFQPTAVQLQHVSYLHKQPTLAIGG